jgi:nucleotide-binding universal stress UspA family protein
MTAPAGPVLVGFDGSEEAGTAVRWAADFAASATVPLTVLHCWIWPLLTSDLGPVPGIPGSGLRHAAEATLAEGRRIALAGHPNLRVITAMEVGYPAEIIVRLSGKFSLVVAGSRGLGGFLGLLVGSVSLRVAGQSRSPTAVIRQDAPAGMPIMVAVDQSRHSLAALDFACQAARLTATPLTVVHVEKDAPLPGIRLRAPRGAAAPVDVLAVAVARVMEGFPDLQPETLSLHGRSIAGTLVEASRQSGLLVLGRQGAGADAGSSSPVGAAGAAGADGLVGAAARPAASAARPAASLGSTAHAVLQHSAGNVVITAGVA